MLQKLRGTKGFLEFAVFTFFEAGSCVRKENGRGYS